jgi:cyclophilin family peptidyl-prolyl cis-trans isomerase
MKKYLDLRKPGGWKRLHNEEHHNLYASLNIIRVIKSRMTRGGGAYNTHVRAEKYIQNFDRNTWREETTPKT